MLLTKRIIFQRVSSITASIKSQQKNFKKQKSNKKRQYTNSNSMIFSDLFIIIMSLNKSKNKLIDPYRSKKHSISTHEQDPIHISNRFVRIVVQVEVCDVFCEKNSKYESWRYNEHYKSLKNRLKQHRIIVKKKSLPLYLYKKSPYDPANLYYHKETHNLIYFPRKGAFELYFNEKLIFSKISSKTWPSIQPLLAKIYALALQNYRQSDFKSQQKFYKTEQKKNIESGQQKQSKKHTQKESINHDRYPQKNIQIQPSTQKFLRRSSLRMHRKNIQIQSKPEDIQLNFQLIDSNLLLKQLIDDI